MEHMPLRAHHFLCMTLFEGYGYSDGFSQSMSRVIERIRENPDILITVLKENDMICKHCPNLMENGMCSLSNEDVVSKDEKVIRALELENLQETTAFRSLHRKMCRNMDQSTFEDICDTCRWYKQGLCSYDKLRKNLQEEKMLSIERGVYDETN